MMTIGDWLASNRDYDTGVLLYDRYGKMQSLKTTFRRGPNAYNVEKLGYELQKLVHLSPSTEIVVPVAQSDPESCLSGPSGAEGNAESGERKSDPESGLSGPSGAEGNVESEENAERESERAESEENAAVKKSNNYARVKETDPKVIRELDAEWRTYWRKASGLHQELDHMDDEQLREDAVMQIMELRGKCQPIWDKLDKWRETGELPQAEAEMSVVEKMKRIQNLRSYITKANKGTIKNKAKLPEWEMELNKLLKETNASGSEG